MDMEPGIINVKQEVPGVGTMNQKVGFVSMLLSATGMGWWVLSGVSALLWIPRRAVSTSSVIFWPLVG